MSVEAPLSTASGPSPQFDAPERAGGRGGVILGASLAAVASVGLAWWLGADDAAMRPTQPAASALLAPASRPLASPVVDETQVARAYQQFQALYAEGGMDRLMDSARNCETALRDDPRLLDFCLALDMYVSTLPPQSAEQHAWFAAGSDRRLALARDAMADGEAAPVRIAAIERLTRIAAPRPGTPAAVVPPPPRVTPAPAKPAPAPQRMAEARRTVSAVTVRAQRSAPKSAACLDTSTAPGRLVCATPSLQRAHRDMLRAYDRAIAAGMDEHRLNRAQARWRRALEVAGSNRKEVARLYKRRIWELNADARARE